MKEVFINKLTNKPEELEIPLQINIQEVDNGFIVSKAGFQNEQGQPLIKPRSFLAIDREAVLEFVGRLITVPPTIVKASSVSSITDVGKQPNG